MNIENVRDLIIIIYGCVGTVAIVFTAVFIAVLSYSLYRRVRSILDSVKAILATAQAISSYAGIEVVKPLIQFIGFIQGIVQSVRAVSNICSKRKGGKDGQ